VRRIKVRPLIFEEELTAYQRPSRLDYQIVKLNVPFEHHGGSIRLNREGDATHVDWRSSFTVPIPLVGRAIEVPWLMTLRRAFRRVLEDVERALS
jgi:Polyketide cyclase / dehydrase and lipid transport